MVVFVGDPARKLTQLLKLTKEPQKNQGKTKVVKDYCLGMSLEGSRQLSRVPSEQCIVRNVYDGLCTALPQYSCREQKSKTMLMDDGDASIGSATPYSRLTLLTQEN